MSPLLYACQNGHSSLAQLLITTNADVNKQDTRGWTVSEGRLKSEKVGVEEDLGVG